MVKSDKLYVAEMFYQQCVYPHGRDLLTFGHYAYFIYWDIGNEAGHARQFLVSTLADPRKHAFYGEAPSSQNLYQAHLVFLGAP